MFLYMNISWLWILQGLKGLLNLSDDTLEAGKILFIWQTSLYTLKQKWLKQKIGHLKQSHAWMLQTIFGN